jgi:hypothetical protein
MLRQPSRLGYVFEQVAAKQRLWPKLAETEHIGGIGQIRSDIDPLQLTRIDMDDLYTADPQWAKNLIFDPRLHGFASRGGTAAKVEQRRQTLGRERVECTAEPASFGFEHCYDARFPATPHDAPIAHRSERATCTAATTIGQCIVTLTNRRCARCDKGPHPRQRGACR